MKPLILHLSNDYPDPLMPAKTRAVSALVEGTPQYRHVVYSLNRVNGIGGIASLPFGEDRVAVAYGALPKGIFWERRLKHVAAWISKDMKRKGIKPDLIEAHKFTIEGVIGLLLAQEYCVPLVCDIQGGTDIKILRVKTSMNKVFRDIAKSAAAVFPYAPWVLKDFREQAGLDPSKCHNLPVVPGMDEVMPAPIVGGNRLMSVFHLDSWDRKNIEGMARAVTKLSASRSDIVLDVYGRGSPQTLLKLEKVIERAGAQNHVKLKGSIESGRLQKVMQEYAAFVMPSKIETYGIVYAEALFSGLPVLLNGRQGISGYFNPTEIGYGCNPHSVDDIVKGIDYLLVQEKALKEKIASMQKQGVFNILRRESILAKYAMVLDSVLEGKRA